MEPWLRKEENTFQFGYFYAQLLTVFAICIFFSSQVPLITVASAFFVFVRHIVDCVNLITVFRKEIDSQGKLIETASNTALLYVIGYQICMIGYLLVKECQEEAFTCLFIFLASILYIVISYRPVITIQDAQDQQQVNRSSITELKLQQQID